MAVQSFVKIWPHFKEGAYAVVFFGADDKATKVFRQRYDAPREHVEKVFCSEFKAYQIAQSNPKLQPLIPAFFGRAQVCCVTDSQGKDISSEFYLDLAYQMEKIEGEFVKLGSLPSETTGAIQQLFRSAGVRHICDASVVEQCGSIKKVIDFAVDEHELEHRPL